MRGIIILGMMILSIPTFSQIWVAKYNGQSNDYDKAEAIAVDELGNTYVTGTSWGSSTDYDYATVKYNPSGDSMWVARYNGPDSSNDGAKAITIDEAGNVYVTGSSMRSDLYTDCVTIKYNSSGDSLWVVRYNGSADNNDYPYAIAVDESGNVYVTGYTTGSSTWWDYVTIKYDSSGVEQWVQKYITDDFDYAIAIAIDDSGNIYVTGSTGNAYDIPWDYVTIKYNSSGVEQWVARYNGPADDEDEASAIAVDENGNVYVTGGSSGLSTGYDYTTIKYNSSGISLWVKRYNGPANGTDWANVLTLDEASNVYVAGGSAGSGTGWDYATIKYNSSGDSLWAKRYNGPANAYDEVKAIAVDGGNNVYVTGSSYGSGTGTDYATVKYDSSGVEEWVQRHNGSGNDNDYAYAIAVDSSGYIYVTGESKSSGTDYDYVTIKYSSAGVEEKKSQVANHKLQMEIYPTPFTRKTVIHYSLNENMAINDFQLTIHDITGRIVKTLVSGKKDAGSYNVSFNAEKLASGIYFVKLIADSYNETKKLILVR